MVEGADVTVEDVVVDIVVVDVVADLVVDIAAGVVEAGDRGGCSETLERRSQCHWAIFIDLNSLFHFLSTRYNRCIEVN